MSQKLFSGYKFVAAATVYKGYGGLGMYIKFQNNGPGIHVTDASNGFIEYKCPDRTIVFSKDGDKSLQFRPNNFDRYIDLNLFQDDVSSSLGIDYIMTNFTHDSSIINRQDVKNKKIQILSDSGGLQLMRGNAEIIDPKDLIQYYNKNVDAGMVLDLPLWVNDKKIAERAAKVQRKNSNAMLKYARKDVELINIFHGTSVEDRLRYRDIVVDDRIPRCAIGGFLRMKYITAVNMLFEMMHGVSHKQYHMLGVFNIPYIALIVKIANTGDRPHITSDATSHLQQAKANGYFFHATEEKIMTRMQFGIVGGSISNTAMRLICSCPICSNVKYRDLFSFIHGRFNWILAIHNAITMINYTNSLQEACNSLSDSKYNSYVMKQMNNNPDKKELLLALEYIDSINEFGLRKAQQKYKHYLGNWKSNGNDASSLFDNVQRNEEMLTERTLKLLSAYESM